MGMEMYELKLFGPQDSLAPVRSALGTFTFQATDNLTAISHAKSAYSLALLASDYAYLHHLSHGTIWEDFRRGA